MWNYLLLALGMTIASSIALAHPEVGQHSLLAGFEHPLTGYDHLLAMLAVGALAARRSEHWGWILPIAFTMAMVFGAVASLFGLTWPLVDVSVAMSLVILGLALIGAQRIAPAAAMALLACFGLAHGHAHALEWSGIAPALYIAGLVATTLSLQLIGFASTRYLLSTQHQARLAGIVLAILGTIATCNVLIA